ncbi:MAG: guanylate kinase [Bacteroidetes bacterium]|nr:guanylate kinase [Bacteroidota bacterium]
MNLGKIIIITAPSGSGKTTLVKRLLQSCPQLGFSISACTRSPRPNEKDGIDYYFFTELQFKQKIEENAFVEWEMVYTGKFYGTLRSEMQRIWDNHQHPLVDIDVKGALALHKVFPSNSLTIFIKAPSLDVLRERLQKRNTETPQSIEERLQKATYELSFADQFDKIVINDNLELAVENLHSIILSFLSET